MEFENLTVLSVDDDPLFRKFLRTIVVKRLGANFIEAGNPPDMFIILKKILPDLLILDMEMPYMDGLTALRKIRFDPKLMKIPVIACTALATPELLSALVKLQIEDYIVKASGQRSAYDKIQTALDKILEHKKSNKDE